MKKIVVVDDQPVLASIYRSKFAAEGFQVDVAVDGEAALEVIQRSKPDLVLLDLMLPKIKGVDVLKSLRANASFKTLPILVFSSSAQPGLVEEAWAAGASMVLSKSTTSPKQLVESVINALAVKASDDAKAETQSTPSSQKSRAGYKKQILLVETNMEVRAILGLVLPRDDFQVSSADGCAHALMLTEVAPFDLVMVNHRACLEPLEKFCQQLRRRRADLPVLMYSTRITPAEKKRALDGGVSEFISTAEQLLDAGAIALRMIQASAPPA